MYRKYDGGGEFQTKIWETWIVVCALPLHQFSFFSVLDYFPSVMNEGAVVPGCQRMKRAVPALNAQIPYSPEMVIKRLSVTAHMKTA